MAYMRFKFIFTLLLLAPPAVSALRNTKDGEEKAHLRRSDVSAFIETDSVPIPGLQVSEKIGQSHFAPTTRWSAQLALLELGPPPWWTPASPKRTFDVRHLPSSSQTFDANNTDLMRKYGHIAVNVEYNNLGEEILTFPERRPREFNAMLATCKTWTADALVQVLERRRGSSNSFDWQRSLAFAMFGLVYVGLAQWFLYVSVLTWLFPDAMVFANAPLDIKLKDRTGLCDMAGQISVDMFCFGIFIYFPMFYIIKAMFQAKGPWLFRAHHGLSKYRNNILWDNLANCALWMPADVVIFACPMYLRMPMEHLVSFGWTMFMSAYRGATDIEKKPEKKPPQRADQFIVVKEHMPTL